MACKREQGEYFFALMKLFFRDFLAAYCTSLREEGIG